VLSPVLAQADAGFLFCRSPQGAKGAHRPSSMRTATGSFGSLHRTVVRYRLHSTRMGLLIDGDVQPTNVTTRQCHGRRNFGMRRETVTDISTIKNKNVT